MKLLLIITCAVILTITAGVAIKPVTPIPKQQCWRGACKVENTRQAAGEVEADSYTPVINIWGYD